MYSIEVGLDFSYATAGSQRLYKRNQGASHRGVQQADSNIHEERRQKAPCSRQSHPHVRQAQPSSCSTKYQSSLSKVRSKGLLHDESANDRQVVQVSHCTLMRRASRREGLYRKRQHARPCGYCEYHHLMVCTAEYAPMHAALAAEGWHLERR